MRGRVRLKNDKNQEFSIKKLDKQFSTIKFQSLLYQFKLKFQMINPFDITKEFQLLNDTTRYYCHISKIDDLGMFDPLVHTIYAENKNFSTHITTSNDLHILNIDEPYTNYIYHRYGTIEIPKYNINSNYIDIGIFAESSTISAFFQLIEGIATNGYNSLIRLLNVADTLDELVLIEELIWYMEKKKINVI